MIFPIGRKRQCTRRDPRLAAVMGLLAACTMGGAGLLQRYHGPHETLLVAGLACAVLIALAVIRLAMHNRDDGK